MIVDKVISLNIGQPPLIPACVCVYIYIVYVNYSSGGVSVGTLDTSGVLWIFPNTSYSCMGVVSNAHLHV